MQGIIMTFNYISPQMTPRFCYLQDYNGTHGVGTMCILHNSPAPCASVNVHIPVLYYSSIPVIIKLLSVHFRISIPTYCYCSTNIPPTFRNNFGYFRIIQIGSSVYVSNCISVTLIISLYVIFFSFIQ